LVGDGKYSGDTAGECGKPSSSPLSRQWFLSKRGKKGKKVKKFFLLFLPFLPLLLPLRLGLLRAEGAGLDILFHLAGFVGSLPKCQGFSLSFFLAPRTAVSDSQMV
jgi:hypothetical protein